MFSLECLLRDLLMFNISSKDLIVSIIVVEFVFVVLGSRLGVVVKLVVLVYVTSVVLNIFRLMVFS